MTGQNQTPVDNETLQTIRRRRSIRSFSDQPVSDEQIQVLLTAANEAPSAHNQQAWRFIVLRNRKKQELADRVSARANDFPRPSSALLRMAARSIMSAPVVIAVANTGELMNHGTDLFKVEKEMAFDFFRTMEIQSSAAAAQNLLLAVTATGLAAVWLGILYLMKDDVLQLLGEPEGEFMAVIPVGYAQRETAGPQKQPVDMRVKFLD